MAKCISCDKKIKISRNCPALNTYICSTCCGSKRGKEINCLESCNYFIEGALKENRKEVMKIVKESFNTEYNDLYKDIRILELVEPFERFIFDNFYNDKNVNDDFISDCYMKIYYRLDGKEGIYTFDDCETSILDEFLRIADKTKMPTETQKQILIRMIKSVFNMTGGDYGNRMYLELLRNNFTGTGLVADLTTDL